MHKKVEICLREKHNASRDFFFDKLFKNIKQVNNIQEIKVLGILVSPDFILLFPRTKENGLPAHKMPQALNYHFTFEVEIIYLILMHPLK